MPRLTDPIRLGAIDAPNRMLMAPLTRGRATVEAVPTPIMADHYRQRASAGLIVSEATGITRAGLGWPYAPGLWSDAQVAGWRVVTGAVHADGGRIVAQLWHMGRLVHPELGGGQPVSASAIQAPGDAHVYGGKKRYAQPRALDAAELPGIVADYARAAERAMEAGFDGVQLHAANGYLIDQFLRDGTNHRDDGYGGAIEHRIRLLGEVCVALASAIGADRVGARLSPNGESQGTNDGDPHALFGAAAALLDEVGVAWLELREPRPDSSFGKPDVAPVHPVIRRAFSRPLVLNSDYDGPRAQAALDAGEADAIAFGRPFIANPDLPRRIADGLPLNPPQPETFYTRGEAGYTDYPAWQAAEAVA